MRTLIALLSITIGLLQPQNPKPRAVTVLSLGHNSKHHDAARFAPILRGALASDGIDISYTPDPRVDAAGREPWTWRLVRNVIRWSTDVR